MMKLILLLAGGLALGELAACDPARESAVSGQVQAGLAGVPADLAIAQRDLGVAVTAYGVAKGLAEVAELAQPSLAQPLIAAELALDPQVARATALLADAAADAPQLTALATSIIRQVAALTVTAAPAIAVVARPG